MLKRTCDSLLAAVLAAALCGCGCEAPGPAVGFDWAALRPGAYMVYGPDSVADPVDLAILLKDGHLAGCHAEVVAGRTNGQWVVLAARYPGGVNYYPARVDATLACVRWPVGVERFDSAGAERAVAGDVGKSYQVSGLLKFLWPWEWGGRGQSKRLVRVCSPTVARYERGGGMTNLLNRYADWNSATPADLFMTGGAVTVWRNPAVDRLEPPKPGG